MKKLMTKKKQRKSCRVAPASLCSSHDIAEGARADDYGKVSPETHLRRILSDRELASFYKRFLDSKYCGEILSFWLAVEEYKRQRDFGKAAEVIVAKFLTRGAENEVNLDMDVHMAEVRKKIDAGADKSLFDVLQRAAFQLQVHDSYPKFMASKHYRDYLGGLELHPPLTRTASVEHLYRYCSRAAEREEEDSKDVTEKAAQAEQEKAARREQRKRDKAEKQRLREAQAQEEAEDRVIAEDKDDIRMVVSTSLAADEAEPETEKEMKKETMTGDSSAAGASEAQSAAKETKASESKAEKDATTKENVEEPVGQEAREEGRGQVRDEESTEAQVEAGTHTKGRADESSSPTDGHNSENDLPLLEEAHETPVRNEGPEEAAGKGEEDGSCPASTEEPKVEEIAAKKEQAKNEEKHAADEEERTKEATPSSGEGEKASQQEEASAAEQEATPQHKASQQRKAVEEEGPAPTLPQASAPPPPIQAPAVPVAAAASKPATNALRQTVDSSETRAVKQPKLQRSPRSDPAIIEGAPQKAAAAQAVGVGDISQKKIITVVVSLQKRLLALETREAAHQRREKELIAVIDNLSKRLEALEATP